MVSFTAHTVSSHIAESPDPHRCTAVLMQPQLGVRLEELFVGRILQGPPFLSCIYPYIVYVFSVLLAPPAK